jgi:uncharacterized protein YrrD
MELGKDVATVNAVIGRSVLSLSSGNRLGTVRDLFIDPLNGVLSGITLNAFDGSTADLLYDHIHSFGNDAIMASSEESLHVSEISLFDGKPRTDELIGTQIITDGGNVLGQVANIYVTLVPPPFIIYEVRDSFLDKLLGRQLFIPASATYALSDDRRRMIVPNEISDIAASSIEELLEVGVSVRSFSVEGERPGRNDDTVIVMPLDDDETVVRRDEDETIVRRDDEDETVIRFRRTGS